MPFKDSLEAAVKRATGAPVVTDGGPEVHRAAGRAAARRTSTSSGDVADHWLSSTDASPGNTATPPPADDGQPALAVR